MRELTFNEIDSVSGGDVGDVAQAGGAVAAFGGALIMAAGAAVITPVAIAFLAGFMLGDALYDMATE